MKVLVAGGGGFLGSAIVRLLRGHGHEVRSFARNAYPALDAAGVEQHQGDLADAKAVHNAVAGCGAVFHVAAKAGVWGPYDDYRCVNVLGTENILRACREHGVQRLVYTSTPSVVFDGRDESGIDESAPYPSRYLCHYARTKAEAEQMVLNAADNTLATAALRPHLIWGPDDPHLTPRIIARARAGKLRFVGDGRNRIDSTYIDNAALAHWQAFDALAPGAPCSGKAYFISNGEPMPIADLINGILDAADEPPVTQTISPRVAYAAGAMLEAAYGLGRKREEPMMTRFVARQLSTEHWFDLSAARRDFGYTPAVSIADGLTRLRESLASA